MSSYITIDSDTIRKYCHDCLKEIDKKRKRILENGIEQTYKNAQNSIFPWRRKKTREKITQEYYDDMDNPIEVRHSQFESELKDIIASSKYADTINVDVSLMETIDKWKTIT